MSKAAAGDSIAMSGSFDRLAMSGSFTKSPEKTLNLQMLQSTRDNTEYDDAKPEAFLALAKMLYTYPDAPAGTIPVAREGFNALVSAIEHKDGIGSDRADALQYMNSFVSSLSTTQATQQEPAFYVGAIKHLETLSGGTPDVSTLMAILDCSKQIAKSSESEDAFRKVIDTCDKILAVKPTMDSGGKNVIHSDSASIDGTAGDFLMRLYATAQGLQVLRAAFEHYSNAVTGGAEQYTEGLQDAIGKIRTAYGTEDHLAAAKGLLELFSDTQDIRDPQQAFEHYTRLDQLGQEQNQNMLRDIIKCCQTISEDDENSIVSNQLAGQCYKLLFSITKDTQYLDYAFKHYSLTQDLGASLSANTQSMRDMTSVCELIPQSDYQVGAKLWSDLAIITHNPEHQQQAAAFAALKTAAATAPNAVVAAVSSATQQLSVASSAANVTIPQLSLEGLNSLAKEAQKIKATLKEKGINVKTNPKCCCGDGIDSSNSTVISVVKAAVIALAKDLIPGANTSLATVDALKPFIPFIQEIVDKTMTAQNNVAHNGTQSLLNAVVNAVVPQFNKGASEWLEQNPVGATTVAALGSSTEPVDA
jgi:hypothetical protein